jgi:uncharacterized protein (DUF1697 family)
MPTNCKMSELAQAIERGGFTSVATVRGSGNVLFSTEETGLAAIRARLEAVMERHLGRVFAAHVRSLGTLAALAARDPFASLAVAPGDKRDVTFLRAASTRRLSAPRSGAAILGVEGDIALSTHTPHHPDGPVFMKLVSKAFGEDITTRTWESVLEVLAKR